MTTPSNSPTAAEDAALPWLTRITVPCLALALSYFFQWLGKMTNGEAIILYWVLVAYLWQVKDLAGRQSARGGGKGAGL